MNKYYLIKRKYGKSIYLHPFLKKRAAAGYNPDNNTQVLISNRIQQEEREEYLYEIFAGIDRNVNYWVQELKYIPRLLNSAGAFLIIYFFLSFVVRDPIPVIDELLIAGGSAVGVYLWTAARNRKSDIAMKKRVELKGQAEKASFTVKDELHEIEELLKQYDELPAVTLADKVCGEEGGLEQVKAFAHAVAEEQKSEFEEYLRIILRRNDRQKKILKKLPTVNTEREKRLMSAHLLQLAGRKRIDLPLLALYLSVAES